MKDLSIIIRASGERTLKSLYNQLYSQKLTSDSISIVDDKECFEHKLKRSFEQALTFDKPYSLLIDADILVVPGFRKHIDRCINKIRDDSTLGFGLKLLDKFYQQPKYRGVHLYNTKHLKAALEFIPEEGATARPETYVKDKMGERGYEWDNAISSKVVGLHDYYQQPKDIYYKYYVRSKRSVDDIPYLRGIFASLKDEDYRYALKGLDEGLNSDTFSNNKEEILNGIDLSDSSDDIIISSKRVQLLVLYGLFQNKGLSRDFFRSLLLF